MMDKDLSTLLERYKMQLEQLVTLNDQLLILLSGLQLPTLYNKALSLKQRIASETLTVRVIGRSGQGKSTIINGLQQQNALSDYQAHAIFLFYEARWGEERSESIVPADAVLVVSDCDSLPTREELLEIDRMQYEGHKAVFFLCNRFDLVTPSKRAGVKRDFLNLLSPLAYYKEEHVFFVNARDGLGTRLQDGVERPQNAPSLEDTLYAFLLKQCGWARFIQYVAEFMSIGQSILPVLSAQEQLQDIQPQELQTRDRETAKQLEQLEKMRQHVSSLFTLMQHVLREKVGMAATNFFLESMDTIEGWPQTYSSAQPPAWGLFAGNAQERSAKEMITFLTARTLQQFQTWVQLVLQPLLQERLQKLEPELDAYTRQFAFDVERIWARLFGEEISTEKSGGTLWTAGIHEAMQNATTRITDSIYNDFYLHWHSIILIRHLLREEELRALVTSEAGEEEIEGAVSRQYRRELLRSYQQHSASIVEIVANELQRIEQEVDAALRIELEMLHAVVLPPQ
ncbi:MAG TPA: hypothetical protein VGU68_11810 [Ktedonobacteraceae bacterium]|nr:hypothetical protein [Ktedonobacteraceae bacterium]